MPVLFGADFPDSTPVLRREVLKWLMSLDLSHSVSQNARHDLANGFLIAEVCNRYYPADISMHSFANGTSTRVKMDNWEQLQRFFAKRKFDVPGWMVEDTYKGVRGAAIKMIELCFTLFTSRQLPPLPSEGGGEVQEEEDVAAAAAAAGGPQETKTMGKAAVPAPAAFGAATVTQLDSQDSARRRVGAK